MTADAAPEPVLDMPATRPDQDLHALLRGPIVISIGVPQGRNVRSDDPTSLSTCLIRNGERFSELTPEAFALWVLLAVPRAPSEIAASASHLLPLDTINQAIAQLQSQQLVLTLRRGPTWEASSKLLRVLPTAYGVGNSPAAPSRYRIQSPRTNLTLSVDTCSFWNWLSWDGTRSIYDAAIDVASELTLPVDVVLEYALSLLVSCVNTGFVFVEHIPFTDGGRT